MNYQKQETNIQKLLCYGWFITNDEKVFADLIVETQKYNLVLQSFKAGHNKYGIKVVAVGTV